MILVVEDDPIASMLATDILEEAGYRTVSASTAEEALDILDSQNSWIDTIFTDVRMPGHLDGLDLARIICDRWPDKRVVVTSGHIHPAEVPPKCVRFIEKPWTTIDILNVVV